MTKPWTFDAHKELLCTLLNIVSRRQCTCKYKSSAADLLFVRNYPAEILKQTRYASPVFISDSNHFYRQPMKLREGNVFSRVYQPVCLSLYREGPRDCEPVQTCLFGNPPPLPWPCSQNLWKRMVGLRLNSLLVYTVIKILSLFYLVIIRLNPYWLNV